MSRRNTRGDTNAPDDDSISARGILDRFTSIDNLVRETNESLRQITQTNLAMVEALEEFSGIELEVGTRSKSEYPYDMSEVVPSATERSDPQIETFSVPKDSTLVRVIIGWPDGAQQAVGAGVRTPDDARLVPRGPGQRDYLAFNDKVLTFDVNEPVHKSEELKVRFINNDPENDHFINVVLVLRENN